ncbi:unnamed protein product [Merluccius merluccius]
MGPPGRRVFLAPPPPPPPRPFISVRPSVGGECGGRPARCERRRGAGRRGDGGGGGGVPSILFKGSGENQFISLQPAVIATVMGNGRRRSISCPSCNGAAQGNKLLAPVALAWGIDGSLFVGDFNYVRRIFPSGNVSSVMELR